MTVQTESQSATLILTPINSNFDVKELILKAGSAIKIGRKVSSKTAPESGNGYFDAKVLSRVHGELSFQNNNVWIQDLQSSNGTFVNGERLSEDGKLSALHQLKSGDVLDFGVDIKDDEGKVLYSKVSAKVTVHFESGQILTVGSTAPIQRIQDADDLIAMLQDEKTMSIEAADALEKIRASFELLEKNVTTKKKSNTLVDHQHQLSNNSGTHNHSPVDLAALQKSVLDASTRLDLVFTDLKHQKADFEEFKKKAALPSEGLKVSLKVCEERLDDSSKSIAALGDSIKLIHEGIDNQVSEAVKASEERLLSTILVQTKSIDSSTLKLEAQKTESLRLQKLIDDLLTSNKVQKEKSDLVSSQIATLTKRLEESEKKRGQAASSSSTTSPAINSNQNGSSLLMVFVIVFFAGLASSFMWYGGFRIDTGMVQRIAKSLYKS